MEKYLTLGLMVVTGLGVASSFTTGCCSQNPHPQPVILCQYEAGVGDEPFEADTSEEASAGKTVCARSCRKLSDLKCPEAVKPLGGKTCVETCKSISKISSFDPECVAKATTKTEVRSCPQIKCLDPK